MSAQSPVNARVTRRFEASADHIFDALLDPRKASKFMFATPTGQMVRAEIDPRVGGKYIFVDRRNGEDVEHTGEYLEIDRPRRLVFTFSVPKYSKDVSRVAIELVPHAEESVLTLTQEMSPEWAEYKSRTEEGWAKILEGLDSTLKGIER